MLRGSFTKAFTQQDLVSWPILKLNLVLSDDTFKDLVMLMAQSEIINCENYINRALTQGEVTVHYDSERIPVCDIYLPMPITGQDPDITITADGVAVTGFEVVRTNTTKIKFATSVVATEIKVVYTPTVYENKEALIPGILLKVSEYFSNRENISDSRSKVDPATIIYNSHRIKISL